ncbi:MAG: winged helix-turn-helix domain-containing protein [Candidatus Methanofastidiosa archaeon]|jgi:predicted transcriptional regulator|nr:winged helix-turn-helix domain-containing protein [Candidatus Methanofastidiosa archaeon]MDD4281642.1 winged helix-turn-helix domain-containing protein [Candidatus Methanofastidiosa archaeon]
MESGLEEDILDYLKQTDAGATASEISRALNINRMTAVKYLEVMRATGLIDYRKVGMAKQYFATSNLSYAQAALLLQAKQLLKSIETIDDHVEVFENTLANHLEIILTYRKSDVERFYEIVKETAARLDKKVK